MVKPSELRLNLGLNPLWNEGTQGAQDACENGEKLFLAEAACWNGGSLRKPS
jgi:hypothetical protein